jgi:redox-sensitive bicupin YhaK (pirin superfamily)
MSGPVTTRDVAPVCERSETAPASVEVGESREAQVGLFRVRRALPRRARRTIGAWCFVDHIGPAQVTEDRAADIAPHPHIGLQTVTWLFAGELLHRDSLGSEQVIRPGQLNLMTAGHGVSHSEEGTGRYSGPFHGVQLWVAQPEGTRHGDPAFEHHGELPRLDLPGAVATALVGEIDGAASPARRDTDHVGVDLELHADATVPLQPAYEYGLVVFDGAVSVEGHKLEPGHLAYLGSGRDECRLSVSAPARALLVGGVPFGEPVLMWWNFVARDRAEIEEAHRQWATADERFGRVASPLPRIEVGPPPWADQRG